RHGPRPTGATARARTVRRTAAAAPAPAARASTPRPGRALRGRRRGRRPDPRRPTAPPSPAASSGRIHGPCTLPAPAWTVLPAADRRRAVLAQGRPHRRGGGLVHRAAAVAAAVRHAPPRRPRGAARLLRSGRDRVLGAAAVGTDRGHGGGGGLAGRHAQLRPWDRRLRPPRAGG